MSKQTLSDPGNPPEPLAGPASAPDQQGPARAVAPLDASSSVLDTEDWRALWRCRTQFTSLETCLGPATNFLTAWQAWRDDDPSQRCDRLHFVSIESQPAAWNRVNEKHAIESLGDAAKDIHANAFIEPPADTLTSAPGSILSGPLARALLTKWPLAVKGLHRLEFEQGKVVLTLVFDTLAESLSALWLRADVIFLNDAAAVAQGRIDAAALAKGVARLAGESARLVCSTPGPALQASLITTGFVFDEYPGDTHGAHVTRGRFAPRWRVRRHEPPLPEHSIGLHQPLEKSLKNNLPVSESRHPADREGLPARALPASTMTRSADAMIIGAGLAGCALAERLASRGLSLVLIDASDGPAMHASGNPAGVFHPLIASDDSLAARATRAGFLYALTHWKALEEQGFGFDWRADGLVQVATNSEEQTAYEEAVRALGFPKALVQYVSTEDAYTRLGAMPAYGGLYFPHGGMLDPASLCRAQLAYAQSNTSLIPCFACSVAKLERSGGLWHAIDQRGSLIASAPIAIVANAAGASTLASLDYAPTRSIRGQLTWLEPAPAPALRYPLIGDGYVLPIDTHHSDARQLTGASYELDDADAQLRASSQLDNLERLGRLLPDTAASLHPDSSNWPLSGRVAFRCVTSDRMPMIGPLADESSAREQATRLSGAWPLDLPRMEGLYGAFAYGSRGLIWAALGAEMVASQILGEPLPVTRSIADGLDPARFLLRALRQREVGRKPV
jgi:tRNA 5-methylaminomethyl-2-thiouridine biosynthesis bifunctional protein